MLYCYDCQKSFPRLRDLRKHERVHRRLKSCQQCDAMFSTAEAERAHIQEKHHVSTGCQTDPERSRQHQQRPKKQAFISYIPRKTSPTVPRETHWRPARGRNRATPVPTVASVAVKTETDVLELHDDYDLN